MLIEVFFDVLPHRDLRWRDEADADIAKLAQEVSERTDSAPVGEISDHRNADAVDVTELVANRI